VRKNKAQAQMTKAGRAGKDLLQKDSSAVQRGVLEATRTYAATMTQLADEMGIADITLSSWRRGARTPSGDHVKRMAEAMRRKITLLSVQCQQLEDLADALKDAGTAEKLGRKQSKPRSNAIRDQRDQEFAALIREAAERTKARRSDPSDA
jgi:transcriptional regulator with XRE-family HTH domain